jgi:quinoprotein glucose dehydrogenase
MHVAAGEADPGGVDALPALAYPWSVPETGTPYAVSRPALSPLGSPATRSLAAHAVDLVSGKVLWKTRLGTTRDQAPFPLWLPLGAPNLGGSIVTAGGVVFIGATTDKFLRGFDAATGEEIWSQRLPYTANATPMTPAGPDPASSW